MCLNLFSLSYLDQLNHAQKEAVETLEGPVMVLAGAGSGKTRVLTYRIAHLIHQGVDSFRIMALTFTNKAAQEMKHRINQLLGGSEAMNVWMGTFHSVFARILRYEADKIGYPSNFSIYDTDDSLSLIRTIIKEYNLDDKTYKPSLVLSRISAAKNNLVSADEYLNNVTIQSDDMQSKKPLIGKIYQTYQRRCFQAGAMDFDDLLYQTNILLRDFPDVLHKYQDKFQFMLVDEFQDTNFAQYTIVKKICAKYENICVVGDDAQSIYAFRGANIQNILNFKKDFPDTKVIKLEHNYRSTQTIVNASNGVIAHNKNQFKKSAFTENPSGDKIFLYKASTDNEEGLIVANDIFQLKMQERLKNNDFAILYRTNSQSRALEEALRKKGIIYKIYGGLSFYKRKEIKDLIAYFRLCVNPKDEEALKRVINYPIRGIGKTSIDKMIVHSSEQNTSIWEFISNPFETTRAFNGGTRQKIEEFVTMIQSFQAMLSSHNAYDLGSHIAKSCGILKDLYEDKTPEGLSRYENIMELLNGMKEFTEKPSATEDQEKKPVALSDYLSEISLLTDVEENEKEALDAVSLMTIHSAKGLEFPYVFIVGLEENLFPSQMSVHSRDELEEERRLFYVALTRAKKRATLSFATSRYRWGNLVYNEPSRFISEVDESLIEAKNLLQQRVQHQEQVQNMTSPTIKRTLKKIGDISLANAGSNPSFISADVQIGQTVLHEKFGKGQILQIEGDPSNQKALIQFEQGGAKQLLLKYAKLKVIS